MPASARARVPSDLPLGVLLAGTSRAAPRSPRRVLLLAPAAPLGLLAGSALGPKKKLKLQPQSGLSAPRQAAHCRLAPKRKRIAGLPQVLRCEPRDLMSQLPTIVPRAPRADCDLLPWPATERFAIPPS